MRIAQSWLTEILQRANDGWSVTPAELDAGFVRVGLEVEGEPEQLPEITGPLTIGRVASIEELEGFKKPIRFCLVEVGGDELQQIVCGARNFAEGDLVVVALPGTVLPGGFEIGKRKTYGKPSEGMICSASELGIGSDHSGIIVLAPGTAEPGDPAGPVLAAGAPDRDTVIELNVTPDRGYCLSARGLARELACGFDLDFADPAVELGDPDLGVPGPGGGVAQGRPVGLVRGHPARRVGGDQDPADGPVVLGGGRADLDAAAGRQVVGRQVAVGRGGGHGRTLPPTRRPDGRRAGRRGRMAR